MDCRLPDFSIHGIVQAEVLEWGAIAFSDKAWKILNLNEWLSTGENVPFVRDQQGEA